MRPVRMAVFFMISKCFTIVDSIGHFIFEIFDHVKFMITLLSEATGEYVPVHHC